MPWTTGIGRPLPLAAHGLADRWLERASSSAGWPPSSPSLRLHMSGSLASTAWATVVWRRCAARPGALYPRENVVNSGASLQRTEGKLYTCR